MSLILNIDTATDIAHISLSKSGVILDSFINSDQKEHGSFLQPSIQKLLKNNSIAIESIDAVAISIGPGSYTGLRVGMASAKGICFAMQKPLIAVNSLEIIAFAAILENIYKNNLSNLLICPMIDARRMEVFTALYTQKLEKILEPQAMIIDPNSFENHFLVNKILFVGNGAKKWELICKNENAFFTQNPNNLLAMNKLSFKKYENKDFSDLAYSEPSYLKEFFDSSKQP
jgi:tRNA threonylcarbamoyladenosine biosynthesis protein TsaB